jgi:hypothetical protein
MTATTLPSGDPFLTLRMAQSEIDHLTAVAREKGCSRSALARDLLRRGLRDAAAIQIQPRRRSAGGTSEPLPGAANDATAHEAEPAAARSATVVPAR